MTGKQRRGRQQQIRAQHHQLAMGEIEHAAHPVDHHIAARDQCVDRCEHDNVDEELQTDSVQREVSLPLSGGRDRARFT